MIPLRDPSSVVIAPDVLGKSFFRPDCRAVLELWRDGRIRICVTPALLRMYAGLLGRLGVPDAEIRRWLWWFTDCDKAIFVRGPDPAGRDVAAIVIDAAERGGVDDVVSTASPLADAPAEMGVIDWSAPGDFVEKHLAPRD